jgi:hypothetical protein
MTDMSDRHPNEVRDIYEAELKKYKEALDTCHRVMLYKGWNTCVELSLEHDAWEAANRLRNPEHYTPQP